MLSLLDILGQNKKVLSILQEFKKHDELTTIIRLDGLSGTGKTLIANQISLEWDNLGNEYEVLILSGNLDQYERSLFPFKSGMAIVNQKNKLNKNITKGMSELVKGIPFAGDFMSYMIEHISTFGKQNTNINFLSEEEFEILAGINLAFKRKKLLVVAENFQYWDEFSVKLLNEMFSKKTSQNLSVFKNIKLLLVQSTDIGKSTAFKSTQSLKNNEHLTFTISKISKNKFGKILDFYKLDYLNQKQRDLIFVLTNGHIGITKEIIEFSKKEKINWLLDDFGNNSGKEFLEKILAIRLQKIGKSAHQITSLLEMASIIGIQFSYDEILCLSKTEPDRLKNTLREANDSLLIKTELGNNEFSSDLVREFFLCRVGNQKSLYYRNFAKCLAILKPSDYKSRADFFFQSGDIENSTKLYILEYLKSIREGQLISSKISSRIDLYCKDHESIRFYFSTMKKAYKKFSSGQYKETKHLLFSIEDVLDRELIAEKYYLLSNCLSKNLNDKDLVESQKCLLNWDDLKNTEFELWFRISLTLTSKYAHMEKYVEGRQVEREILSLLVKRIKFDSWAEFAINVIRRKSSILHSSEVSCKRTKESIHYFQNKTFLNFPKYPIQLYMSLINHSGNLLNIGNFKESFKSAKLSILFQKENEDIVFPRREIAYNNLIISGYFLDQFSLTQGISLFENILSKKINTNDNILVKNNFYIFLALNGEIRRSFNLFKSLSKELGENSRNDLYFNFYVDVNLSTLLFLRGKIKKAKELINKIKNYIPKIPDSLFLEKRIEMLKSIYNLENINSVDELESIIKENYPLQIGPGWNFYGFLFLFSDLQFWSDT